jgi:hypothetical protein
VTSRLPVGRGDEGTIRGGPCAGPGSCQRLGGGTGGAGGGGTIGGCGTVGGSGTGVVTRGSGTGGVAHGSGAHADCCGGSGTIGLVLSSLDPPY